MLEVGGLVVQDILLAVVDTPPPLIGFAGFTDIQKKGSFCVDDKIDAGLARMAIGRPLEKEKVLHLKRKGINRVSADVG